MANRDNINQTAKKGAGWSYFRHLFKHFCASFRVPLCVSSVGCCLFYVHASFPLGFWGGVVGSVFVLDQCPSFYFLLFLRLKFNKSITICI